MPISQKRDLKDTILYALPRFSNVLKNITDFKAQGKKMNMTPAKGFFNFLALVGVTVSINSYFVGAQNIIEPDQTKVALVPLGRDDVEFKPMVLVPPVQQALSYPVNFSSRLVGGLIPDIPLMDGTPQWNPETRQTIWNHPTLAMAFWTSASLSLLISSLQGLFTRSVPMSKQRQYATKLNGISKLKANPDAIGIANLEVAKANSYGQARIALLALMAVGGWGFELFLADGVLATSVFSKELKWGYSLASTFLAEGGWYLAESIDVMDDV